MLLTGDTDLATALAAPVRRINRLLEIDWNRNGAYDHAYSDMSDYCVSAEWDGQITGDLPDSLQTITGYSSREIDIKLAGRRAHDELMPPELLSPYLTTSPLYGKDVVGTPMRYSRVVDTPAGARVIRQFTGWIRSFQADRADASVTLTGSDVLDLDKASVSLPLWAWQAADYSNSVNNRWSGGHEASTTWVIEEILRQAGRPTGPAARSDAVAYWTCNGSFLPSIGGMDGWRFHQPLHLISYMNADPWFNGPYGLMPKTAGTSASAQDSWNLNYCTANRKVAVPVNGSAQNTVKIGMSGWIQSNGAAGYPTLTGGYTGQDTAPSYIFMYLDDAEASSSSAGYASFQVNPNGTAAVQVRESGAVSTPRTWTWEWKTPLSSGFHYMCPIITFASGSIICQMWIDDVLVSATTTTAPVFGYRYAAGIADPRTNYIVMRPSAPIQHVQIFAGNSATTYTSAQKSPPTREGKPLAVVGRSFAELTWVPDTYQRPAWAVLQEVVNAEYGTIYTDEYGTVYFGSHAAMRNDANLKVVGSPEYTDDNLLGLVINPTADHARNVIQMSHTYRASVKAVVWQPPGPYEMYGQPGYNNNRYYPTHEVIYVVDRVTPGVDPKPDSGVDLDVSSTTAVYAAAPASPLPQSDGSGVNWNFSVDRAPNTRLVRILWNVPAGKSEAYIGAYAGGGNEVSMAVVGRKYSDSTSYPMSFQDTADVNSNGRRVLTLPDNDWRQTPATITAIANDLLKDTVQPVPLIDGVSMPCDPRLQLGDVIGLKTDRGMTQKIFAQIIGKKSTDNDSASTDSFTLRVIRIPGTGIWDDTTSGRWDTTLVWS